MFLFQWDRFVEYPLTEITIDALPKAPVILTGLSPGFQIESLLQNPKWQNEVGSFILLTCRTYISMNTLNTYFIFFVISFC